MIYKVIWTYSDFQALGSHPHSDILLNLLFCALCCTEKKKFIQVWNNIRAVNNDWISFLGELSLISSISSMKMWMLKVITITLFLSLFNQQPENEHKKLSKIQKLKFTSFRRQGTQQSDKESKR